MMVAAIRFKNGNGAVDVPKDVAEERLAASLRVWPMYVRDKISNPFV